MIDNEILLNLDKGSEYGVKYKNAVTPLVLLKVEDNYCLHGFFNINDTDSMELVSKFVFEKPKGEVVHFAPDEDYCSLHLEKKELEWIFKDSKVFKY